MRATIGVGAAGLCAFVAAAAWLVHGQAEAYRRVVGPDRQTALQARLVAPHDEPVRPSLGRPRRPIAGDLAAMRQEPARPRPPRRGHLAPVRPPEAPAPPPPLPDSPPPASPPTVATEAKKSEAPPQAAPAAPTFLTSQRASELSVADQEKLGLAIHDLLVHRHPAIASPELAALQKQLDAVLAALRGSNPPAVAGPSPRLVLVPSAEVRAFSHIGGQVYVSLALLDFAPDPAELEFVLARELSHLDRRHAAKQIDAARGANSAEIDLVAASDRQLTSGYTAEQEFEADADAYRWIRSRGRTHRQTVGHLRRLAHREASRTGDANSKTPTAAARLARLEALADK